MFHHPNFAASHLCRPVNEYSSHWSIFTLYFLKMAIGRKLLSKVTLFEEKKKKTCCRGYSPKNILPDQMKNGTIFWRMMNPEQVEQLMKTWQFLTQISKKYWVLWGQATFVRSHVEMNTPDCVDYTAWKRQQSGCEIQHTWGYLRPFKKKKLELSQKNTWGLIGHCHKSESEL